MAIEMGAAAKAAAGLCLVGGGGAGAYYGYSYLMDSKTNPTTLDQTKYDRALIDFIKENNQDIVFEVKKDQADFTKDDLALTTPTTATAKVQISTTNKDKFKGSNSLDNKITEWKQLNGNKDWTWSCSFTFQKANGASQNLEDTYKQRIIGDNDKGLFGILKKDLSSYADDSTEGSGKWKRAELKDVKTKFIEECAKLRRETNPNLEKASELTNNAIEIQVPAFEFEDKTDKLEAKNAAEFDKWFKTNYQSRQYNTAGGGSQ